MRGMDSNTACTLLLWGITGRNPYRDEKTGLVIPSTEYKPDLLKLYAASLSNRCRNVDLIGIPDLKDKRAIPLEKIFVDLECIIYHTGEKKSRVVNEVFEEHPKLAVLGDPGAGKSTLLKYLTLQAATQITADKIRQVPILIILRNYAHWRTEPGRKEVSLLDYYYWHCNGDLNLRLPSNFFERLLQRGLCTVFFDGYDELAGNVLRDDIRKIIEVFAQVRYPRNRYILSSRIAGYERVPLDKKYFTHIKLVPFSPAAVKSFIRKWYTCKAEELGLSERERDEKVADLQQKLEEREQVDLLARNPLLLTMIAIIHRNEAHLPEERFRLYEKITEALLETWEQNKAGSTTSVSLGRLRIRLAYLAEWMHTLSEGREERQAEVEKGEIARKLTEIIQQTEPTHFKEDKIAAGDEAKGFLEFVNLRAGLLIESGDGIYRFLHLSFQEYFAAYYFNEQDMGKEMWEKLYLTHIPKGHYKEVLLLLFAMMVHGAKKKTANYIVQKCREEFWRLSGIDPETIHRGMVIGDVEKTAGQLGDAFKKQAADFLLFAKHALADCLDFEGEEKAAIAQSFLLFEMYYGRFVLYFIKKIKQIQDKELDFQTARNLALDHVHALDFVLARDLAHATVCAIDIAIDIDIDIAIDRADTLDIDRAIDRIRDFDLDIICIRNLTHACAINLARTRDLARARIVARALDDDLARDLARAHARDLNLDYNNTTGFIEDADENLQKMQKNCIQIIQKSHDFLIDTDKRYIQFSSLVALLMGIITSYRWYYMKEGLPWNYPGLDTFIETGGGLMKENTEYRSRETEY